MYLYKLLFNEIYLFIALKFHKISYITIINIIYNLIEAIFISIFMFINRNIYIISSLIIAIFIFICV